MGDETLTPDDDASPLLSSGSSRPQFLFPRNHSQSFIEVQTLFIFSVVGLLFVLEVLECVA